MKNSLSSKAQNAPTRNSKVICFANPAESCGKTSCLIGVADHLNIEGYSTLLIDLDHRSGLFNLLGHNDQSGSVLGLKDYFKIRIDVFNLISISKNNHHRYIETKSNSSLFDDLDTFIEHVSILKDIVNELKKHFDFILIDTSPSFKHGSLSAAIMVSDYLIAPIKTREDSDTAIKALLPLISMIERRFDNKLQFLGAFHSMYPTEDARARVIKASLKEMKYLKCFDSVVPLNGSIGRRKIAFSELTLEILDRILGE